MKCSTQLLLPFVAAIVAALAVNTSSSHAAVLFSDTFNRPDNRDIDAVTTGITNNTGTTFGASAVYTSPWVDPATDAPDFGVPDGVAGNGGGQQILSNEFQLKYSVGTANAFVNHNFTNASILSAGGFSVSLDLLGYNQAGVGQGAAIAVGMSLAEALTGHDANDGGTSPTAKFTNAFQNTAFTTGTVLSDFYLGLRGDSTLAWGSGTGAPTTAIVAAKTGTISASFGVTSFAAGSTVSYEVFYNGASQGVGSFAWSGTNENYIGLDGRDNTVVTVDNFSIDSVVPPPKPMLVINRDNGNITLQNQTSQPLSVTVYSITTEDGGFDQNNWSKIEEQNLDANDEWFTLTAPDIQTDLSEGTLGEYTIGANGTATDEINFGNAWRKSPFEDIGFELRNAADNEVPVIVSYTGNGGQPFGLADYNFSGLVDAGDWPTLRNHLISDVSAMSPLDAYQSGDLNSDGLVDRLDFREFKELFEMDNGSGSFATMLRSLAAPEPSTAIVLIMGLIVAPSLCRRSGRRIVSAVLLLSMSLAAAHDATAANLFTDTFDRPDNRDIDAVTTGITNNTGTTFGASAVYTSPWVDPATDAPDFGIPDADPANGGGQQILNNEFQLKYNMGTANAFVNHNFTNASILSAGGFSVSLDLLGYNQATVGQGAAIAVGMSLAEAQTGHDANDGGTSPTAKFTNAFQNTAFTTGTVLSDFYLGLRGDATLAWGVGSGSGTGASVPTSTSVAAKTGTISAQFVVDDFSAGSSVAYEVFYNGVSQGFGAFTLSGTNENFIGLDGRDSTDVRVDNFKIETVAGLSPKVLRLQVNTTSGAVSIAGGAVANALDFYEIHSGESGLVFGNFDGLRGAPGFPAGNGTGNGWELNDIQTATVVSESYLQASSTFAAGGSAVSLGAIYNTALNTRDLQFLYDLPDGTSRMGFVEYIATLVGDFNNDNSVNAADYTVWRNNLGIMGGATPSQGDANGDGNVTEADYTLWKAHYGEQLGGGAGALSGLGAPEPNSAVLLLLAGVAVSGIRIRARTPTTDSGVNKH